MAGEFRLESSEAWFLEWTDILGKLVTLIHQLEEMLSGKLMQMILNIALTEIYLHYDQGVDFMQQFRCNSRKLLEVLNDIHQKCVEHVGGWPAVSALLLQPIVVLPEWETVPSEPDAAIDYLAQWDNGEYSEEPEEVETLYPRYGNAWRKGDYVLQRFPEGTHALYRVLSEEGSASSSVMGSIE